MPRASWTAKDERQFKHIRASCVAAAKTRHGACTPCDRARCERTAAATVNKGKAERGETRTFGRHCPRGTVPIKGNKTMCYDRHTHRRVHRTP